MIVGAGDVSQLSIAYQEFISRETLSVNNHADFKAGGILVTQTDTAESGSRAAQERVGSNGTAEAQVMLRRRK